MKEIGYEAIAHVPSIFDSAGRLCRLESRYLRERATGDWWPEGGKPYVRELTILNIGNALVNFVGWCEELGNVDSRTATYNDVLRYQRDQTSGRWSREEEDLEPSTANTRADEVTTFLTWAAQAGLRPAFPVKRFFARGSSFDGKTRAMARAGRARENETTKTEKDFILPKPAVIKDWLRTVREKRGYVKYLAARFILSTGARKTEVELLDVDQWPTVEAIEYAAANDQITVPMDLFETKGGKPRTIWVPLTFALRVRRWIDGPRMTYALRWYKHKKARTRRLFLSDHKDAHGRPLTGQTIYRVFHEVEPRPKGWSPHKGRHAFACFYVLYALEAEAGPEGIAARGKSWVSEHGKMWLNFLRKQFGHVSERTTERYLVWLSHAVSIADISVGWHRYLEDEGSMEDSHE